jgi:hypothetical protein
MYAIVSKMQELLGIQVAEWSSNIDCVAWAIESCVEGQLLALMYQTWKTSGVTIESQ